MSAAAVLTDPVAAQDALRPLRNFVALLAGASGDQTWADTDAYAVNPANQFATQGPTGVALEGKPVVIAPAAGAKPAASPLLLIALGVGLAWLLRKA